MNQDAMLPRSFLIVELYRLAVVLRRAPETSA